MFNKEIYPKRNEERCKQFERNDHLNTVSPLTEIGIGVINLFLLDYMHLVCFGTVQIVLKKGPGAKISANQTNEISSLLVSLKGRMPSEFSQKYRTSKISIVGEQQSFVNSYCTLDIVLQDIISDNACEHFLTFSIILSFPAIR